ncbi:four helix bundle protein [Gaoshiqia sediminis]|uniref:Four helix bundle protein n=1 Tax=Gaoshiqia sediminis TaxID=2986998 RepID=A0AA41Y382_9BACT|nr:four helix bundle protein [Gaoshiqia sediminis]MCW0482609.1 four helix bundle protein [Gaoshiqia sediminis]
MSKVQRFEDLKVWQSSRVLCKMIHGFTLNPEFCKDFKLISQIKSSSGSVMDNIAEGYERDGNKEFIQFLSISKGSCGECRSQLYRALDNGYISEAEFKKASEMAIEISKMLSGFMDYLHESELKGKKFK